ncbi:Kynurenine 3-monooxygenase [Paramyrothecium foliicola]|nr:Kynurenine 3-monooxygenase [Paramyrothecium foliicola]
MEKPQKIVVVGAGPVGSLAALYAAQRGYEVEVYELRPDLRHPATVPLNFTKSINLALSERGIQAMRQAGRPELLENVMAATIPMRGRMIHGKDAQGNLQQQSQDYDVRGRAIFAVDRAGLNTCLLDILDATPNVKLFFNHKLTGADFLSHKAWLEDRDAAPLANGRPREIEVAFDLMIGADGAHSAVRYHLMKFTRMNYQQEYIDTLWCEFRIRARAVPEFDKDPLAKFRISPNHLHIWPGKDFMFIAIPSEDGSFTCTLFLPSKEVAELETDPSRLPAFFDKHFPGVTELISGDDLISSFQVNPHLPLISLKCSPYHYSSSGVVIGDAAHAMVPFYGQGMNAGMEDVRVLFSILDKHMHMDESNDPTADTSTSPFYSLQLSQALTEYSIVRAPDAHTINDLALQNYVEMRSSVLSRRYRLRKFLEEFMSVKFPSLGWQTKYARVSFSNEAYSEIVRNSEHQGKVLVRSFFALLASPAVLAGLIFGYKYRRSLFTGVGIQPSITMPSILNIANMCSHLQNASMARLGITSVMNSKYNLNLAAALHRSGFLSAVYRAGPHPPTMEEMLTKAPETVTTANAATRRLWLGLKYWDGKPVLSKARVISKPSRLVTVQTHELARIARGLPTKVRGGIIPGLNLGECMFLSTPRGILEAREALSRKVGGLLICRVS